MCRQSHMMIFLNEYKASIYTNITIYILQSNCVTLFKELNLPHRQYTYTIPVHMYLTLTHVPR